MSTIYTLERTLDLLFLTFHL